MNKKQLKKMGFEEAVRAMIDESYPIADRDDLEAYAIDRVMNGYYSAAITVLEALKNGYADYFEYTYSGETPEPLETIEDLERLL